MLMSENQAYSSSEQVDNASVQLDDNCPEDSNAEDSVASESLSQDEEDCDFLNPERKRELKAERKRQQTEQAATR